MCTSLLESSSELDNNISNKCFEFTHYFFTIEMLFNNLIPLSTGLWAHFCLGEPITPTFCAAMILIVAGVLLGQMDWSKIFKLPESF